MPSALTAALAALLLLLAPVSHAWAGNVGSTPVAQSQAAHHDEAVTTTTGSRASVVRPGGHAPEQALPPTTRAVTSAAPAAPTSHPAADVDLTGAGSAGARAPPLKA